MEHISSREPEPELSASSEESAGAAADLALRAAERHERKVARKAEKADTQAVRDGSAARQRPSSRLQFTEEERADPALAPVGYTRSLYLKYAKKGVKQFNLLFSPEFLREKIGRASCRERV